MRQIEIQILNETEIIDAERAMLAAARLTQRGHKIRCMEDFLKLYDKDIDPDLVADLCKLPHVTLQKFGVINVMVIGLSRRALAQLTRHQNEVKFMAGSLQYSNYAERQNYVIPPGLDEDSEATMEILYDCASRAYDHLIALGCSPDQAGYVMPQGFRTSLLISATPYQWKHMIGQRVCRRNTPEVRYIMLKIWQEFAALAPELFESTGPSCYWGCGCEEGKLCCGRAFTARSLELEELLNENKTDTV